MTDKIGSASTSSHRPLPMDSVDANPRLMFLEALMFAAIAVVGAAVTYELTRGDALTPQEMVVTGMIEAEALAIVGKSGQFDTALQDTSAFSGGQWSGNQHLFVAGRSQGDTLDLALPAHEPGPYELTLYMTRSFDYGTVEVSVNDERVGEPIDLWAWGVEATGPLRVGTVRLQSHGDVIRFEVIGRNTQAMSPFYQFGIDGFVLESAP